MNVHPLQHMMRLLCRGIGFNGRCLLIGTASGNSAKVLAGNAALCGGFILLLHGGLEVTHMDMSLLTETSVWALHTLHQTKGQYAGHALTHISQLMPQSHTMLQG
jgi:hypothetical protein